MSELIETQVIKINKACPLDVFRYLHRLAYFTELMDRTPDGKVIWDETRESIYCPSSADAEWTAVQNDWLEVTMEIPKASTDMGDENESTGV